MNGNKKPSFSHIVRPSKSLFPRILPFFILLPGQIKMRLPFLQERFFLRLIIGKMGKEEECKIGDAQVVSRRGGILN